MKKMKKKLSPTWFYILNKLTLIRQRGRSISNLRPSTSKALLVGSG
jgi:hypothetical protein